MSVKWPHATPPAPVQKPVTHVRHGQQFNDPYAWLRDENWQQVVRDPKQLSDNIREHLRAENQYAKALLDDTQALQAELLVEMKGRMVETEADVPARDGHWFYNTRYSAGAEHPLFVRYPVAANGEPDMNNEQILLDGNLLANNTDFFQLGTVCHSPDHRQIAWTQDTQGSEFFHIFVRDLETNTTKDTEITAATSDLIWTADSQCLLWVWRDENSRPKQVRRHQIGTNPAHDPVLYAEADDGFFLGLQHTSDRKFALICSNDHETSEIWTIALAEAAPQPVCLWPRKTGTQVDADHLDGSFTLLTNAEGAKDFQIIRVSADDPSLEMGEVLTAHRPGVLLLQQQQFASFHVRLERENALPRVVIRREDDGVEHEISFEEPAFALGFANGYQFDTPILRFATSTPAQPRRVFAYHMEAKQRTLLQEQQIPSGHKTEAYQVTRIYAPAKDGQTIPITLLNRSDMKMHGSNPVLLYGYGAYGISISAGFSANRLSLVDRGVVFAIAHVRGGKEKGFGWYEAGRREHKTNTFDDFIACAEHLIEVGVTKPANIVAMGGSAGGMLVGAVANLRPDLFAGLVAQVPFVDVLNTMSDESLPLTPPEWPEWGNPVTSAEACENIAGYCPLTNVRAQAYPPVFATAGLTDTRVTWWEPAKWIATLRYTAPNSGPFLLKTEMSAGHGGASGRYAGLAETTEAQAFTLKVLGLAG
ncbi:MAG: S9 family peptidase [Robiginitomaculum sp.]|nr:S9 family peptidase [Robiginitomaculum sp.]